MMAKILEVRELIKRFYAKYEFYANTVFKFLLAWMCFSNINQKIGFMQQLRNPLLNAGLALACALIPLNGTVVLAGLLIVAHSYALSMETFAVTAVLLLVMYLLYFRISSKMAILLVITPLCFKFGIPYVVPLFGGLLFGVAAAIPAGCGVVIHYLINYMNQNSTSLSTGDLESGTVKVASLMEGVFNNKEMFLCVAAMMLTIIVVFVVRRLSIDHSWEIAIGVGTVLNLIVHLAGAMVFALKINIVSILLGSLIAVVIALIVKLFVFNVDYTRGERVQFEDDEYYYYVKAVPKNAIAVPKKTVKKIAAQKKQPKIIKKIDSGNGSKE